MTKRTSAGLSSTSKFSTYKVYRSQRFTLSFAVNRSYFITPFGILFVGIRILDAAFGSLFFHLPKEILLDEREI